MTDTGIAKITKLPEEIHFLVENRKISEQKFTGKKREIDNRRLEVYKLQIQGYSNQEIADKLKVSLSTIEKDLSKIKDFAFLLFNDLNESGIIPELIKGFTQIELVESKLWDLFKNNDGEELRLKILKEISEVSLKKLIILRGSPNKYGFSGYAPNEKKLQTILQNYNNGIKAD